MLNFTKEERKVILFVCGLAILGIVFSYINKAIPVTEKIVFPREGLAKIDINKISLDELIRFKCVSEKLAQRIIEYRLSHRNFASLDELEDVKGIGQTRAQKLREIFFIE